MKFRSTRVFKLKLRPIPEVNSRQRLGANVPVVSWIFVGLWYVAVVHRFHVGPTSLEVMSISASAVTGMTVAAGVYLAS